MKELVEIQNRLKAPKSQYNSFGKYKYRSCEDILEAVKPLLHELNCQLTISDDIVLVGNRIYVKATVAIRNEAGEIETTTGFAREEENKKGMDGSQVTGASSSYARKYALNGMFCIDDTKDSDTTNTGPDKPKDNKSSKGATSSPVDSDTLDMAIQEIRSARCKNSLLDIYNTYKMLHGNSTFMSVLAERKKELGLK